MGPGALTWSHEVVESSPDPEREAGCKAQHIEQAEAEAEAAKAEAASVSEIEEQL